jgi:hypothetical protein
LLHRRSRKAGALKPAGSAAKMSASARSLIRRAIACSISSIGAEHTSAVGSSFLTGPLYLRQIPGDAKSSPGSRALKQASHVALVHDQGKTVAAQNHVRK